jgi:hypothetical protein
MAVKAGTTGVVKVHTTDGSETAVAHVRSFSFDTTADTIETTAMHDSNSHRTYITGLESSTVSMELYWDTDDTAQALLNTQDTLYWELYPHGTGSGETYYSGAGICTGLTVSAAFDGMVEASATIQCTTAVGKSLVS